MKNLEKIFHWKKFPSEKCNKKILRAKCFAEKKLQICICTKFTV